MRVITFPQPLFPSEFQLNEANSQSQSCCISTRRGYTPWEHLQFCLNSYCNSYPVSLFCAHSNAQENIPSSHPHSPVPSTLWPPGVSEMFLLEGQRQTEGAPGVKPLPLYTGCQFSCIPCFIYSGSCELCWYSWTALLWTHDCSPGGRWTFAAGGGTLGC